MEEVLAILHEIDFLQEKVSLLLTVSFLQEHVGCCCLQLVVGPLDLLDVDLLFLVHFLEPIMHDLLFVRGHGAKGVEELSIPHNCGMHDHLIDHLVRLRNQRIIIFHVRPN